MLQRIIGGAKSAQMRQRVVRMRSIPSIPPTRILLITPKGIIDQKWQIHGGILQSVAARVTPMRGSIIFGMCIYFPLRSREGYRVMIPSVAQKESQKLASNMSASGLYSKYHHATATRILIARTLIPCRIQIQAILPIIVARITGISHPTSDPYRRTDVRIMLISPHRCRGKYRSIHHIQSITKAIFEPLTTRICISPEALNVSLVSDRNISVFPMLMPISIPAVSRGNPRKKMDFAHSWICSRIEGVHDASIFQVRGVIFPNTSCIHVYREKSHNQSGHTHPDEVWIGWRTH